MLPLTGRSSEIHGAWLSAAQSHEPDVRSVQHGSSPLPLSPTPVCSRDRRIAPGRSRAQGCHHLRQRLLRRCGVIAPAAAVAAVSEVQIPAPSASTDDCAPPTDRRVFSARAPDGNPRSAPAARDRRFREEPLGTDWRSDPAVDLQIHVLRGGVVVTAVDPIAGIIRRSTPPRLPYRRRFRTADDPGRWRTRSRAVGGSQPAARGGNPTTAGRNTSPPSADDVATDGAVGTALEFTSGLPEQAAVSTAIAVTISGVGMSRPLVEQIPCRSSPPMRCDMMRLSRGKRFLKARRP